MRCFIWHKHVLTFFLSFEQMFIRILSEEMQWLSGRVCDLRSEKLLTGKKTNQTDQDSHPNFFLHKINN